MVKVMTKGDLHVTCNRASSHLLRCCHISVKGRQSEILIRLNMNLQLQLIVYL